MPRIGTKSKERRDALTDAKLLELGRRHFSEDFPNPKRLGCPAREKLKQLAERPLIADELVLNHISFCSPCYRAFSRFSQARKRKLRSRFFSSAVPSDTQELREPR